MKKGFTLAEVLITLAIIGVVAAITLPTLMQDGRKQQLGAKIAKFQSNLEKITRGYAIESDLTVAEVKDALHDELLFSPNANITVSLADNTSYELRDGTQITMAPIGVDAGVNGSYYLADSKLGAALIVARFTPNIPGLDGQTNFDFVITTKGFVIPNETDTCLQQIVRKNFKASSIYNTSNCPKGS